MKSVTLITSSTVDHIDDQDREMTLTRAGGPALYCGQAMKAMGLQVHLITADHPVDVRITIRNGNESIWIDRIGMIKFQGTLPTENVVLSPILGEFDLKKLARRKCQIFLDAQGYIRAVGENLTQRWECELRDLNNVVALKVNERESYHVPKKILELFKSRILLITRGQKGVVVWDQGKRYVVKGTHVDAPDTLGAGDTFFGSFIGAYLDLADAKSAAKVAITKAEQFLKRKRAEHA